MHDDFLAVVMLSEVFYFAFYVVTHSNISREDFVGNRSETFQEETHSVVKTFSHTMLKDEKG